MRKQIELKYVASADAKLEISLMATLYHRQMHRSERKKLKETNALQIINESFQSIFEETYSREALALKEFPKLEGLDNADDNDNIDSGSGDNDRDDFSLYYSNWSRSTRCNSKSHLLNFNYNRQQIFSGALIHSKQHHRCYIVNISNKVCVY